MDLEKLQTELDALWSDKKSGAEMLREALKSVTTTQDRMYVLDLLAHDNTLHGDYQEAERLLREVASLDESDGMPLQRLGSLYVYQLRDYNVALPFFEGAVKRERSRIERNIESGCFREYAMEMMMYAAQANRRDYATRAAIELLVVSPPQDDSEPLLDTEWLEQCGIDCVDEPYRSELLALAAKESPSS